MLGWLMDTFIFMWHMPFLMLLAGMSSWFALRKRTAGAFLGERVKRILLPLLFGILLVIPPQVYYERLQEGVFSGNFFEFYPTFFTTGIYPHGNFSYHHLWFLLYLFLIALVTLPLLLYIRGENGQRLVDRLATWLQKSWRLLFLVPLPIALLYTALSQQYPHSNNITRDWAWLSLLLYMFVVGYLLAANERIMLVVDRVWRWALALAVGLAMLFTLFEAQVISLGNLDANTARAVSLFFQTVWTFGTWFWLVGFLGLGRAALNRTSRFLRYASEIAYPYYILHQTVIVVFGYYVVQWEMHLWVKFGIVLGVSFVLTALLCEVVKRTNLTRFIFGLKPIERPQAEPTRLQPG